MPSGSAAYDLIPAQKANGLPATYPLEAGDVLQVKVFQEPELSVEKLAIDPAGKISLPLVGEMQAGGLTAGQLEAGIERSLATRYLKNPQVSVSLLDAADRIVSVEGEVKQPGVYPINGGSTLLSALALARSPTLTAKLNEVMVFRVVNGERVGGRFDVAMIRAGRAPDPQILPNDVIVVGFSRLQGAYRDLLTASPLFNVFTRY